MWLFCFVNFVVDAKKEPRWLFLVGMLLKHKLLGRHCRKTQHTVMKRKVNRRAKPILAYEPLGTNLLKSKDDTKHQSAFTP